MDKKEHWSKRLKRENELLRADIYDILDGNIITITRYKCQREFNSNFEKTVWAGNITKNEDL